MAVKHYNNDSDSAVSTDSPKSPVHAQKRKPRMQTREKAITKFKAGQQKAIKHYNV